MFSSTMHLLAKRIVEDRLCWLFSFTSAKALTETESVDLQPFLIHNRTLDLNETLLLDAGTNIPFGPYIKTEYHFGSHSQWMQGNGR